jgi:lysophospholipase L1-like esterase
MRLPQPVIVLLVCLAAAVTAACGWFDDKNSPTAPSSSGPPSIGAAITYNAFGASDALGIGSSAPCTLFAPCDNGAGYVQVLTRQLRAQQREVTLTNLGIPAAVLSPTIYALARSRGRDVPANFIEHELTVISPRATLVTIFGGANDVNAAGAVLQQSVTSVAEARAFADARIREFGSDYDRLVSTIRERAPGAFIIVINIPNLGVMPYAASNTVQERSVLQYLSVGFTREANRQARSGVVVLDLMCDPTVYDRTNVSSDGFHPSDAGYSYLAQRLFSIVNGGSSSPSSSCSQMTLLPGI